MAKRKSIPVFWIFFAVFTIGMIAFWCLVVRSVKKCLIIYENSQPEYYAETIVKDIQIGNIDKYMNFNDNVSRFEDPDIYRTRYLDKIISSDLTFKKSSKSYDAQSPLYNIYSKDECIAELALKSTSQEDLMFILSVSTWEVDHVTPIYETGSEEITVTVPDSYKVFVNGIALNDGEKTGEVKELSGYDYSKPYTEIPCLVTYKVTGLLDKPSVVIHDNLSRECEYELADGKIVIDGFTPTSVPEDIEKMVLENAVTWSNYFSRDVSGCYDSISPISYMFPSDSYYLEIAEVYRQNDMWMYSAHQTPVFTNEQVTNYTVYSKDFFSCEVSFSKSMILTLNGQERIDNNSTKYYYVNIDGEWKITDMVSVIEK